MKRLALILVVLCVMAAGAVEWATATWTVPGPPAAKDGQTVVLLAPRTGLHQTAQQLEAAHVLTQALAFELNLRLRGMAGQVKAGEYAIPSRASMADIAAILVSGKAIQHKLTVAEGLTSGMIWKLVKADPELEGDAGAVPQEGTLLPETYLFTRGTTRTEILERMARAQQKFLAAHWAARAPGLPYRGIREAVTLASIVEKETALPQERRHVASVFLNRLKQGMRLQTDPTVIYGLTKGYPLGHGIRQSELQSQTPYNTYIIAGLPPGPIANPGKDSLAAALNPAGGDDLYFVANGTGGTFAATLADHARNVLAWRAEEKRRQMAATPLSTAVIGSAPPSLPAPSPSSLPKKKHRR